jgi:hypothetical protein
VAISGGTCSGAVISFTDVIINGSCLQSYTVNRTWTASCNGQDSHATQLIDVTDTLPPSLTLPRNVTVYCSDSTSPDATGQATASDTCDPNPVVTFSDSVTTNQCDRNITRTWTATGARLSPDR